MWTKHRSQVEVFTFNFYPSIDITAGETTTLTVPVVKVLRRVGLGWSDVTTNFITGTPAFALDPDPAKAAQGLTRLPWLAKAGSGTPTNQPGVGTYAVRAEATTSAGRIIVSTEDLKVVDKAVV